MPASVEVMCLYAEFLSRSFKSYNSVVNYTLAVKLLHEFLDIPVIDLRRLEFKLTLRGIKRNMKHVPVKAIPVTPQL